MAEQDLDLRGLPDDDIAALAAAAEAEAHKHRAEQAKLEDAARKASEAFKAQPSAKLLSDKEVAAQLASNAQEATERHAASIAALLAENTRRQQLARHAEVKDLLSRFRAQSEEAASRLNAKLADLREQVLAEFAGLRRALQEHNRLASEFEKLDRAVGTGQRERTVKFEDALSNLNVRLGERFGSRAQLTSGTVDESCAIRHWLPDGRADKALAELTMRISCPDVRPEE